MPRKGMGSIFCNYSRAPSPKPSKPSTPATRKTFSDAFVHEKIEAASQIILKWDPDSSPIANVTSLFHDNRAEAIHFLKSTRDLHGAMRFFMAEDSTSGNLLTAQNLMQSAMKRLEKEFYQILASSREYLDAESVSTRSSRSSISELDDDDEIRLSGESISDVERVSSVAMSDLKSIADCMVSCGYGKECVRIYKIVRKSTVDEGLYHLGVERLLPRQRSKLDWQVVELKIKYWVNAVKVAVKTLFYGERILCDHVFATSDSIRESCFSEITRDGALTLLEFPEFIAKLKKSPEKIFRTLDVYEALANAWPEIESIFNFESTSSVRSQAIASLGSLGESACEMLRDFEALIHKDTSKSKSMIWGGRIHPITRYVMNYLSLLADYADILSDVLGDSLPNPNSSPMPQSYFPSPSSEEAPANNVSVRIAWLILVLLCKLDRRADYSNDTSLSYIFLANNLQYVVNKVRGSELQRLLGESWVLSHSEKVRQYCANYERMAWSKVSESLTDVEPSREYSLIEARDRFRRFNSAFEEACRKQSTWVVVEPKLREEMKGSIARRLGSAYRDFYEKYGAAVQRETGIESVVRFSPDDFGNYLSDLFHGTSVSGNSISSSPSPSPSHTSHAAWASSPR